MSWSTWKPPPRTRFRWCGGTLAAARWWSTGRQVRASPSLSTKSCCLLCLLTQSTVTVRHGSVHDVHHERHGRGVETVPAGHHDVVRGRRVSARLPRRRAGPTRLGGTSLCAFCLASRLCLSVSTRLSLSLSLPYSLLPYDGHHAVFPSRERLRAGRPQDWRQRAKHREGPVGPPHVVSVGFRPGQDALLAGARC